MNEAAVFNPTVGECGTPSLSCGAKQDGIKPSVSWYVLRYKTLTTSAKDNLHKVGFEVFLPQSCKKSVSKITGHVEYQTKPLIPGYIFVQSSFLQAKDLSLSLGFNLWKKRCTCADDPSTLSQSVPLPEERLYHTIPDQQMAFFKRAVELYKQELLLSDISEIDLQQDDQVEIISGDFKGVRGYLKTTQGKNGGLVVVPVTFDSDQSNDGLCYSIQADIDQIGIISFADGKRHASDCLRSAQQMVDKALQQYAAGKPLSDDTKKQFYRYLARFRNTQFRTDKLRASHLMLLYSIYTMLQNSTLRDAVLEDITQNVLPAFDARIAEARRRGRPDGSNLKAKYLRQKEKVDHAFSARRQKLQ